MVFFPSCAWQVVTKASGGFSDDIASSMHHAGVVVAVDAGMPAAQACLETFVTLVYFSEIKNIQNEPLKLSEWMILDDFGCFAFADAG